MSFAAHIKRILQSDFKPDLWRVPTNYHAMVPDVGLWCEVGSIVPVEEHVLKKLTVVSSGKSLHDVDFVRKLHKFPRKIAHPVS